jgi:K+:H+ antiporter
MTDSQAAIVLLDLSLIIVLARALGWAARKVGQPAVIGELLAGILLGPTLFDGAIANTVFPSDVRPFLTTLANLGVVVFMFLVGYELDAVTVRARGGATLTVAALSTLLPFALGAGLAALLTTFLEPYRSAPSTLGFVLFMGAAMSVTAFPVLARILADRDLLSTWVGNLALGSAAICDVLAWLLLAAVVSLSRGGAGQWRVLLVVPFVMLCFWVVRPQLRRLARAHESTGRLGPAMLAVVVAGLLVCAGLTQWMGLHYIFGAFLFGTLMPRQSADRLRHEVVERIGDLNAVLLLPVFFVVAGLKVDLSDIGTEGLGVLGLILLTAIGGKLTGAYVGARVHRIPIRQSAVLATLMNTRGLTELIILDVGAKLGFLDGPLFTLMVVMAVVTTTMTGPLLGRLYPPSAIRKDQHPLIASGR